MSSAASPASPVESAYAWYRLAACVLLMTIGGAGMYAVVVVLPTLQQEFGIARADASFPFTATMLGFAVGGLFMGKLADRYGVFVPVAACVANAIRRAVGVRVNHMPMTPERVLRAIKGEAFGKV